MDPNHPFKPFLDTKEGLNCFVRCICETMGHYFGLRGCKEMAHLGVGNFKFGKVTEGLYVNRPCVRLIANHTGQKGWD